MTTIVAPPIHRIAITQLVSLLLLASAALMVGRVTAYSVLMGGMVHIVPQAWFTRMAYRYSGARQAPNILSAMYKGEAGKLLLTATLFALMFVFVQPLQVPSVFFGYVVMIVVYGYSAAKVLHPTQKEI